MVVESMTPIAVQKARSVIRSHVPAKISDVVWTQIVQIIATATSEAVKDSVRLAVEATIAAKPTSVVKTMPVFRYVIQTIQKAVPKGSIVMN